MRTIGAIATTVLLVASASFLLHRRWWVAGLKRFASGPAEAFRYILLAGGCAAVGALITALWQAPPWTTLLCAGLLWLGCGVWIARRAFVVLKAAAPPSSHP